MPKITFVILHYMNIDDTLNCILSIKNNLLDNKYSIVVVDNASNNKSKDILCSKFTQDPSIHIIVNEENLGFANGNNVGYKYAKENLKSDFIIMINNDTEIIQKDFLSEIIDLYNESKYHILGPDIITKDNIHQNPIKPFNYTIRTINKGLIKSKLLSILNSLNLDEILINFLNTKSKNKYQIEDIVDDNVDIYNVKLHGSCWIFSPLYIRELDGIYNETFLFLEEDILYYVARKLNFTIMYSPRIKIFHKEDGATDFIMKSNKSKRKFVYQNHYFSYKAFKKLLKAKELDNSFFTVNKNIGK